MPVSSPPTPFTLTAGAALFADQWPTSPQLQAFAKSLERDLNERFTLVDTLYTGLRDFTVHMHGDLNNRDGENRAFTTQHVEASLLTLSTELAATYTPLSDARVFEAAGTSLRADLTALQAELAAAVTRLEGLVQQTQVLAQNTGAEIATLRTANQHQADQNQAFQRDGAALSEHLRLLRAQLSSSGLPSNPAVPAPVSHPGFASSPWTDAWQQAVPDTSPQQDQVPYPFQQQQGPYPSDRPADRPTDRPTGRLVDRPTDRSTARH